MGKIYSILTRPIRNFNIENRARRVISRKKPIPAPVHASVEKQRMMVEKLNPNFMAEHYKKDPKLHDHLKSVYVESEDIGPPKTSSRSLPQYRGEPIAGYYDYYNDIAVSGKCSLKQAIKFLTMHKEDPVKYSIEKISEEYQLDKQLVENIVTNFKVFHVVNAESEEIIKGKKHYQKLIN
ncbi:unnamed protein product [Xylocopa violacea]|uniref:Protein NDUFAF4 homolog n=1 Tax=Xylocopa violacea TaxID=135666 RepID=A0ABP1N0U3_XYLVO